MSGERYEAYPVDDQDEDAWVAVPDLTRLITAPFAAIRVGLDSHEVIASKLYDIAVRAEAIDILRWIGEPGAPATAALIQWALTSRVAREPKRGLEEDNQLFIELVAMDAEQRMRVAGAVATFAPDAFPMVVRLLTSSDAAKRKLGVAILSQDALPVAAELLRSNVCEERETGLLILKDMDLVVPQPYLDELANQIRENCAALTKIHLR
jgi:hypothetical protein